MVQTFATNSNNDIFIGSDGNLSIATGLQGVLDACQTASLAQLGEMIFATTSGLPNFELIWNGAPNYPLWTVYLRNTLLSVEGVNSIQDIEITKPGNTLNYTATIQTDFGPGDVAGSITQG